MSRECDDEDLRREAIDERRARNRATRCQCGDDLPGHCPGPAACPYSDFNEPVAEVCSECGLELLDDDCAACAADREAGERFAAEYGMP